MDCEIVRSLMSSYIDKDINQIDKVELEKHLESCPDCMEEYLLLLSTIQYCNELEEIELPETFHQDLMHKLQELGPDKTKKKFYNRNWGWVAGVAAVFIVAAIGIFSLPGIPGINTGNKEAKEDGRGYGAPQYAEAPSIADVAAKGKSVAVTFTSDESVEASPARDTANYALSSVNMDLNKKAAPEESKQMDFGRKIITSGSVSLQVTDFDNKMQSIAALAERNGGYVENSNVDNIVSYEAESKSSKLKTGNITLRIPAAKFGSAVEEIKAMGEVINHNTNSVDITEQYYDTTTRVDNLKVQESRLRELVTMAKNVDEILKIENELNRVRSDIELMSTDIRRWDKQVSLSSLHVSLKEVKSGKLESVNVPTIWNKAYNGFVGAVNTILIGVEKLFIYVVSAVPYIIILALLSVVAYIIIRRRRGKNNK